jgi:hypothetical protein
VFQVAIDSGDGQHFWSHPWSMSDSIINITNTSNTGVDGRWIFRVDQPWVRQPDCISAQGLTQLSRFAT